MLTRRSLFTLGLATATAALASGCSRSEPSAVSSGTGFSHSPSGYEGRTIDLPARPERLVVDTYSFAAMAPYGIRPVGHWGYGEDDPTTIGTADPSVSTSVGRDAELSLEAVATLKPDALIGYGNTAGTGWTWWSEGVTERVAQIAPYIPIRLSGSGIVDVIEEYRRLAGALGLDVDSAEVRHAKDDFDAALSRIADLTAGRKLRVLALQANPDNLYLGVNVAVLKLLAGAGVQLVPAEPTKPGGPWAEVSWENISRYKADLIMDFKTSSAEAHAQAPWRELGPVKAGQVTDWNDKRPNNHRAYADWLNGFADAYERAEPLPD